MTSKEFDEIMKEISDVLEGGDRILDLKNPAEIAMVRCINAIVQDYFIMVQSNIQVQELLDAVGDDYDQDPESPKVNDWRDLKNA